MRIRVSADGWLAWRDRRVRCALGRSAVSTAKREGDGATPAGTFPLRRVLYRPDRTDPPKTALPMSPLRPDDGWSDDPEDPLYNRPVRLPHGFRAETLWRDDEIYDVIVILGHNDDPPLPGAGSAVFLHVARPGWTPTRGCVALALPDLLDLLAEAAPGDVITIAA